MADSKAIILNRMLGNVSSEYDRSEGSFIYDMLTPLAIELEKHEYELENILDKRFADTATGKDLYRIVKDKGLTPKTSTQSSGVVTIGGTVGAAITKGEYVASDNVKFSFDSSTVIPAGGTIDVNTTCTVYGTSGNVPAGAIKTFPKTLSGLTSVTNAAAFTNGYDSESDEALRERYYIKVQTPGTSGNIYHYQTWALEVTGCGGCRVVPTWNGGGTVKLIIINSNKRAADSTLISAVKNYIDPNNGTGEGKAPINSNVTVVSATEKALTITVNVTYDTNNYTSAQIKAAIETNITEYLATIAFKQTYVSYAKIGNLIFDTTGVQDYTALTVNGGTSNITIATDEIAVLGGVTLG